MPQLGQDAELVITPIIPAAGSSTTGTSPALGAMAASATMGIWTVAL